MHFLLSRLIVFIMFIVVIMTIWWPCRIVVLLFWMVHTIYPETYLAVQSLWWTVPIVAVCVVDTVCVELVFETFLLFECLCGNDFC